jgi:hypothetical protein
MTINHADGPMGNADGLRPNATADYCEEDCAFHCVCVALICYSLPLHDGDTMTEAQSLKHADLERVNGYFSGDASVPCPQLRYTNEKSWLIKN